MRTQKFTLLVSFNTTMNVRMFVLFLIFQKKDERTNNKSMNKRIPFKENIDMFVCCF